MGSRSVEPYENQTFEGDPWAEVQRRSIEGSLIVVDRTKFSKRGLRLIYPTSRALKANEIHELMATEEQDVGPGKIVDNVSIVGFFEVVRGGVAVVGDEILINNEKIGRIVGFDDTHMPNHQNIIIKGKSKTGHELSAKIGSCVLVRKPK